MFSVFNWITILLQMFHSLPSLTKNAREPITATFNLHLVTTTTASNGALPGATAVDPPFPAAKTYLKICDSVIDWSGQTTFRKTVN